ncbi:MAG TPA: peptide chain release factor N(5)-glutamine methyltransferase [Rhabdochlamydiaceae bacterium]|jgi:release factor glutamine methyltransferase
MKNLGEILQLTVQCFNEKKVARSRRTAEELLSHVLGLSRIELYMHFDQPLQEEELSGLRELVKRKIKGEPLEYLLGSVAFYGCRIRVTKDVLIPRPETEILLDKACALLKQHPLQGKSAWDLCSGSGCLGIGLKKCLPQLEVSLSDISVNAVGVAQDNAQKNGVRVEVLQGDLLASFALRKADVIFCNPPYVSNNEYRDLESSVRDFEPKEALIAGEDGLLFYQRLSAELPSYLHSGAKLFFEIGYKQADAVRKLFSAPHWRRISIDKDWAGHERFFFLEFE